ncbi:MBL fold metallo-hydrolase [Dactylosporangium aurantiacum]|uniref:MBL fold metallo-hydrolase n=1 Tax=Dactylosporangium aurantiacum TaxID=35754 RepID=A0A9Q9MDM6_9ACTN|nr:MBL fold metallo-hydrolase [Dactylosporangium aurantiacum]MDG6101940.1 MBL fold metallo-hydrolase [Dactylosporangium aurantiacum]UWZ52269.1 MBL fold metallo-hydrolase [Dactylosporangium aurantiacum]
MLTLEFLDAGHGDCCLVHWQSGRRSMLIDGGPAGTWERVLRARLTNLRWPLEAVCVTHIDDDHIAGVLGLLGTNVRAVRDDQGAMPFKVERLWFNGLDLLQAPLPPSVDAVSAASYQQGRELMSHARQLRLEGNVPFGGSLTSGREAELHGLTITVVTPGRLALERLAVQWRAKSPDDPAVQGAGFTDRSIPNLSSIGLHLAGHGQTVLLTGDARGDDILDGLQATGLMPDGGLHVNVLKLPHHGSANNVAPEFFTAVRADHYVISADGKHGHPSVATLRWLVESRPADAAYTVHVTNTIPHAAAALADLQRDRRLAVSIQPGTLIELGVDHR